MPASLAGNPLSLHHLTALDASPVELIDIAETLACDHVCFFTHLPANARALFPPVDAGNRAEVAARLSAGPVSLYNLEYFPIDAGTDFDTYRTGLALGAELGGRRATAHIQDDDRARAIDRFAAFCAIAAEYGLDVGLEFTGFSHARTVGDAMKVVLASGAPNAAVAVDLLHLVRNGDTPETLAQVDPTRIGYIQICDGPRMQAGETYIAEAIGGRMVPGTGEFPLRELLALLPAGPPIDVEVPQHVLRERGVSAQERARLAVDGARRMLGG